MTSKATIPIFSRLAMLERPRPFMTSWPLCAQSCRPWRPLPPSTGDTWPTSTAGGMSWQNQWTTGPRKREVSYIIILNHVSYSISCKKAWVTSNRLGINVINDVTMWYGSSPISQYVREHTPVKWFLLLSTTILSVSTFFDYLVTTQARFL